MTLSDNYLRGRGFPSRVIEIDGKANLFKFAEIITKSFNFDFDHAFGFYDNLREIYRSIEGYELFADMGEGDQFPGVKKTKIKNVYNEIKKKMLFFFDYGDNWRFITQLIDIQKSEKKNIKPRVVSSVGKAPEQYSG